jgi:hypothetical protein
LSNCLFIVAPSSRALGSSQSKLVSAPSLPKAAATATTLFHALFRSSKKTNLQAQGESVDVRIIDGKQIAQEIGDESQAAVAARVQQGYLRRLRRFQDSLHMLTTDPSVLKLARMLPMHKHVVIPMFCSSFPLGAWRDGGIWHRGYYCGLVACFGRYWGR